MCYVIFICVNVEYSCGSGRLHHKVRKSKIGGRHGWEPGALSYFVLSVFIVFLRENAHIARVVRYQLAGGRLVCYNVFCY